MHALAVNARVHGHDVAALRDLGGVLDGPEGARGRAVAAVGAVERDIELAGKGGGGEPEKKEGATGRHRATPPQHAVRRQTL